MPYNMSIENKEGYIRFDLYDPFTQPEIDDAMKEVVEIRTKQKLNRILCDQRELEVPPSDTAGFLTALQFGEQPLVGTKLAIIRRQKDEERLFEIAAQTRGVIVGIFDDEEAAKQWLLAST